MSTSRNTWKNFESSVAKAWTDCIGLLCKRNPLSGANNRTDKGELRPGDVVIHADFNPDVLLEMKYRSSFMHHGLYKAAAEDAKKHNFSNVLLFTKQKQEEGWLVVMSGDLFNKILAIKEVQKLLQKV